MFGPPQALTNKDKPDGHAAARADRGFASSFNQFFDFDMDNFFDTVHHRYNFEFFRKLQIHLE